MARGLGRGIHEFKRAVREGEEGLKVDDTKKINPGG
ncbi:MAG TPA: twin-arginine translocase TatA/TatE family subunit [candidate division Zixibacteria bacterium]|nr:twin-arginine translocase TatA/TatE family subunit [candidate division Zixibacteria bacterium]